MSLHFLGYRLPKALKKMADPLRELPPCRDGKLGPQTGHSRRRQAFRALAPRVIDRAAVRPRNPHGGRRARPGRDSPTAKASAPKFAFVASSAAAGRSPAEPDPSPNVRSTALVR